MATVSQNGGDSVSWLKKLHWSLFSRVTVIACKTLPYFSISRRTLVSYNVGTTLVCLSRIDSGLKKDGCVVDHCALTTVLKNLNSF